MHVVDCHSLTPAWSCLDFGMNRVPFELRHTGSICLGSLLVSVMQMLRMVVRSGKDRRLAFMACVIDWILAQIENLMKFFNTYAFVYVALYGKTYMQAAGDTWEMIKTRGFDVIINDDLSNLVVFIGCLMGGILSGASGAAWANNILTSRGGSTTSTEYGFQAFVVGLVACSVTLSTLQSAAAALYVCLAEDPSTLQNTRPEEYNKIKLVTQSQYALNL
jgi:hypothetical protein